MLEKTLFSTCPWHSPASGQTQPPNHLESLGLAKHFHKDDCCRKIIATKKEVQKHTVVLFQIW